MSIDLRGYRQQAGMGQVQVAEILGISHEEVSRYEDAPDTLPMGLLVKWLAIFEVDIVTAMSAPLPPLKGIDPGSPYTELYHQLNSLNQYIDSIPLIDKLDIPTPPATPNDFREQIKYYRKKPNLVLTGGFDAGKSHLANALLGSKSLPTGYQPATRVITFVRHIEDRPVWFTKDVLIFNEEFWLKDEKGKQIIDVQLLDDQQRCEKYCIQAGSFDFLQKYGVHGENEDVAAHAAVVYMNASILKACNLIDLPGYADQPDEISKDVEKANSAAQIADILLYASQAKRHIDGQDMIRLGNLLKSLPAPENECSNFPTLGNLFIVATHADPSISNDELQNISYIAAKRLYKNLTETVLERRREQTKRNITEEVVRKRFFTFWSERPNRCQVLFDELTKILSEFLPQARMCRIDREMKAIKEDNTKKYLSLIDAYEKSIADIELQHLQQEQLKFLENHELVRQEEANNKRKSVLNRIDELKRNTKISFQEYFNKTLSTDSVEAIIRTHYDFEKEAKEYLPSYLIEKLQNYLEDVIKSNAEDFKTEIDTFLGGYQNYKEEYQNYKNWNFDFDSYGAFFTGAFAGLGSFGALAVWALANLGGFGGYILIAKFVSFLSALGIGFGFSGGTAGIMAFVASIGGPIVLGIGLSVGIAITVAGVVWSFLTESWQKRLAKQIVKCFNEQKVCEKFIEGIDQFWQDTATSFEKGADAVESEWQKYLVHLHEINSPNLESKERIQEILRILEAGKDFFSNIPWLFINLQC
ncbi:DNA-binding protein [Nostoc sp. MBR 210]|nr:DNA-binding protein [Nostoc sp. MBR 210]